MACLSTFNFMPGPPLKADVYLYARCVRPIERYTLEAFINAVQAQCGNKIPEVDADALIADVLEIIYLLNVE